MALDSLEIDAQLAQAASQITQFRTEFNSIKQRAAVVISKLSQFGTDYSELVSSVAALAGSSDPVDQLQAAKLGKMQVAMQALSADLQAAKAAIDMLDL